METKPCPFCGGTSFSFAERDCSKWGSLVCDCGAASPDVRTGYDNSESALWHGVAAEEWNKRPIEDQLRRERDVALSRAARLRPEVWQFAIIMEEKLRANDHKGGWSDCDMTYLVGRIEEELDELRLAVDAMVDIEDEAADVANFAMMIASVASAKVKVPCAPPGCGEKGE